MAAPPRRYWTSDLHIGHEFVATKTRPFKTVAEHDAHLAERWDSVVRPNDIVYVLGDIAINPRRDNAFEWFANRPGRKHLIAGNHDEVHPLFGSRALRNQGRAIQNMQANYENDSPDIDLSWFDVFLTVNSMGMTTINGEKIMMSHFPYTGEGNRDLEERYSEWRLRNVGLPLLHGHTHKSSKLGSVSNRSIHIGVDAWDYTPVSEAQVVKWLGMIDKLRAIKAKRETRNGG